MFKLKHTKLYDSNHQFYIDNIFLKSFITYSFCPVQCKSFDEAVTNLCELALEKLNAIFVHSDVTVLQAASEACEQILKSRKAVQFLGE